MEYLENTKNGNAFRSLKLKGLLEGHFGGFEGLDNLTRKELHKLYRNELNLEGGQYVGGALSDFESDFYKEIRVSGFDRGKKGRLGGNEARHHTDKLTYNEQFKKL